MERLQDGLSLAITIIICFACGYYLDGKFNSRPWLSVVFATAGIAAGLYNFLRSFSNGRK